MKMISMAIVCLCMMLSPGDTGTQQVVKVVETDRADELEGFTFLNTDSKGIAVTSSRRNNVNTMKIDW